MLNRNVETFLGCEATFEQADFVLFGAPFDSTASYRPGSRSASRTMRAESFGLETFSPYQERDLAELAVCDAGDLELRFGDPTNALAEIEVRTDLILSHGKLPLMLGGEHLVTLGAVRAAVKHHPDLHILHFDAHADLRDDYLGATLSHATVIRRCWELCGDGKIHQFGIRSGDKSEFDWGKTHVQTRRFDLIGLEQTLEAIGDAPIYLTIDLDVLDPSVFPGTGTPEAGGVFFPALLAAIRLIGAHGNVVAADLNELCPPLDPSGISTATACKILRELLLALRK